MKAAAGGMGTFQRRKKYFLKKGLNCLLMTSDGHL
jgi:hypothetical protein